MDFWTELDDEVLGCLARHGACSPADVAKHLGIPESAAVSLVCLLAQQGRIAIRLVDLGADVARQRHRVA